ncbi:MAG: glycerophosphodiester phosphodiesterase family protein [Armatimonadetes bacterium]|nr:glycerophosphodiester phosphodiesterase family protein [Armatimonadota bacterium]
MSCFRAAVIGLILCAGGVASAGEKPVKGYIAALPAESAKDREARHAKIAERRKGPAVIVHRGASAFAPENTMEAYAAAMDYGADGCEIDIRRTADGVLVLFHDDMLENLTTGFGSVNHLTYYELLCLERRSVYGTAARDARIPTFASLLALARRRAMLLHLDIKEPGLDNDIAGLLDEADMWDAVVAVNTSNAGALMDNPKLKLLAFKAPGLYEDMSDVDPEAVRAALAKPGEMIILDDPRVAAKELGRPGYAPVPLPKGLRRYWPPSHPNTPEDGELVPSRYVASLAGTDPLKLLDRSEAGREDADGGRAHREKILARAWAAQRLGEIGQNTDVTLNLIQGLPRAEIVQLLEYQVRHRSLDRDWRYHGMDGAMAVYALASLGAVESAPMLADVLMKVDPALAKARNPEYPDTPPAFLDWRIKGAIVQALGELPCGAGKSALSAYVRLDEESARKLGIQMYVGATKSLMKQKLSASEVRDLLQSPNRQVRGAAILECLDHPTRERAEALKAIPWALELPGAR